MQLPTRILLTTLAGAAALAASAQTTPADPVVLAPISVTADLWESPLARIPASVTVYDAAALRDGAVNHFGDLVNQIPNLTWTGGTSRPRYLQIRGVGENSQFEGETPDSAVRFLVDDLDFTGLGTIASAFDVSQIEVLRGPQAGAFGANAAGGIVRLVTNAPTPFRTGRVEATVGEDALRTGALAVGGPLTAEPGKLMFRLAVQQSRSDGFRRNLTRNRDANARDEQLARLRLTWNPNGAWRWETALFAAELDNGYDEFALDNNGRYTYSDQPGRDEQRSLAGSLRGTWLGGETFRFTTVTSGARTRSVYSYDDDWTAASYMGFSDLARTRWVINQELRLDSVPGALDGWISRWTLGAFYSDTEEFSRYTNTDPWNVRGLRTVYRAKNTALFGQLGHDFSDRTRLVLGLRGEAVDMTGTGTRTRYRASSNSFDPMVNTAPAFDDTFFGGKLTFEHDLTDRALGFVSLTRGYKAGGINVDARIDPTTDPLTYDTETLWNWEAGVRGHGFEGRFTGEVTAFWLQRENTQVRDSAGFGGSYRFFTANGNDAHVYGLEAAAGWALTRTWTVRGSLALMRSQLDPFTLPNGNSGGGRVLANAPEYGYTLGTRYGADRGVFFAADLTGRAQQFDSNNQHESRRTFRVVNASLGYAWEAWTVTLWAKNLFDEVYDKRVYFFGNEDPDYLETRYENRADPRQLGVSVAWQF